ncbi:MAG: PAS domain S-box protein [Raineya sp.]|jgi:PAS domain S-box-containing protein|nr:PAS domain S-box protein [Raineya sp.]
MELNIKFSKEQLDKIFPFYIEFDTKGHIVSQGVSSEKLFGDIIQSFFTSEFVLERPYIQNWEVKDIIENIKQVFFIRHKANDIIFRGQFEQIYDKNTLIFLGSPWVKNVDYLKEKRLYLQDFALHDPTFDFLHIFKQIEINNDEIKLLLNRLKAQSEQIKKSEAQYRSMLDKASDIIYRINTELDFIYVNPATEEILGYHSQEILKKKITDIIREDFKDQIIQKLNKQIQENINSSYSEFPILTKQGDEKWLGQSVQLSYNQEKIELVALAIDITKQKLSEFALIETNKRLELLSNLINNTSDAFQISTETGELYYINKVAEERLGIKQEDCNTYKVQDFEVIFQKEGEWEKHIEYLKSNKTLVIEGVNTNQTTQKSFPVEVTVQYLEIAGKGFVVANSRDITERKLAEKQLLEAKQKLESIFNEMTDVVWSASLPHYKLIFATPSVEKLLGEKLEYWFEIPKWWEKAIHPDDLHIIPLILEALKRYGEYTVKHRVITNTGEIKWVRNKGKIIYNDKNEPVRIDGVLVDRTSQFFAEDNLIQEVRLQEILIDIASTYINLDLGQVETTINKSLEKLGLFVEADRAYIFDYDFDKNTTSNTYEWCYADISAEIDNLQDVPIEFFPQWIEKHQKGEPFYIPDVAVLEDDGEGGLKSILEPQGIKSLISIPMIDGKTLVGFVGFDSVRKHHEYSEKEKRLLFLFGQMLINIRNRQKWEKQLTLQEEKFRNIIANMNLGLLEVDNDDTIIFANQSFCEMSGYALNELKGLKASETFIDADQKEMIAAKNKAREQGVSDSYELEVYNKKGEKCWWFISGAPNYNDKGQLIGSIGIHLDITEQKMLEKQLAEAKSFAEAAAKAKELFLANMSHEIRTPLNVIIGMVRQLNKEDLSTQQQFYVKQSESSAKHLLTIVNNILDIAKIESGELDVINKEFSLSALSYNVQSILYSQTKEKKLDFRLHVSPDIKPALIGDEVRIKQVLINLIGNSIKFTEEGFVSLSVDVLEALENRQKIRFEIEDSGIGMSEAFISRIFDKFSQEQDSANRKFEGTGLGMAISHDLVKLMGGNLGVQSIKGKGTKCTFELDLPIGEASKLVTQSNNIKKDEFKGCKVLLAEDNEMNRFIAAQSLAYLGCDIIEAENGKIAVDILTKESFHLILMDIQMPEMDGVEATQYIRNTLKLEIPIIALTANAFKHDIELYLSKGMNDFITKPYDEQEFFRKIEHYLNQSIQQTIVAETVVDKQPNELFNLSYLTEMSRGNEAFIQKMLQIFCNIVEENTKVFEKALSEVDIVTLQKTAHKIKPSIDQMNILSLKDKIRTLEKYPSENIDKQHLITLVTEVIDTLQTVASQIKI